MVVVVKRPRAELDLLDIWDYIADDSLDRAVPIDAGRILTTGGQTRPATKKFADYFATPDFPLAIVETSRKQKSPRMVCSRQRNMRNCWG